MSEAPFVSLSARLVDVVFLCISRGFRNFNNDLLSTVFCVQFFVSSSSRVMNIMKRVNLIGVTVRAREGHYEALRLFQLFLPAKSFSSLRTVMRTQLPTTHNKQIGYEVWSEAASNRLMTN